MDPEELKQKEQAFHDFFTIKHKLNVNVRLLADDEVIPHVEDLTEHMPPVFRIASEMSSVDAKLLRPLRNLSDHAEELVSLLNHQSRKLDLLMSLVLQQQDDEGNRLQTIEFGAGGLIVELGKDHQGENQQAMSIDQRVELKIFLQQEAAAVFCYAQVIGTEPTDKGQAVSLVYTHIREEDQELLVRASLHLQTQQLKKKRTQHTSE